MRSPIRRLVPAALALLLLATLAPLAATAAELSETELAAVTAAEQRAHDLANAERRERGLVSLRWDARLGDLARARATHMAETENFSHTQSGGTSVFDMMSAAGIKWYGAGEIIAWNIGTELNASADYVVRQWMNSSGHKAIMISKGFNYVGFGVAVSPTTGKRYWAGVYMKGPDRTGSWAKLGTISKTRVDSDTTKVTLRWGGGDNRLQVLTSGLRYFQLQRRRDGGSWYTYPLTTNTSMVRPWIRGSVYEFRVRSRDKAGNWSSWKTQTIAP
jgi:uncharacterized protein YkwD